MREEFEEWIDDYGWSIQPDSTGLVGRYEDDRTQLAWESWQASRAAIEVDLPDWFDPFGGSGEQAYWRIEVDRAIESVGLKVKS